MDGAEAHRRQIDDAFYACSYEMHVGLAEMYIADPRFTATYENIAPGLAQYLHDAIKANAARNHGVGFPIGFSSRDRYQLRRGSIHAAQRSLPISRRANRNSSPRNRHDGRP